MGKPKRFNTYDSSVEQSRKIAEQYGRDRQNLSGVGSTFRNPALEPPTPRKNIVPEALGTGKYLTSSLAADQTTNIAATNHVEFDTKDEDGGIVLQTGVGQADGIFELGGEKKYELSAQLRPEFSGATGQLVVAWYDRTNAAEIGSRAIYEAQTNTSHNANQPVAEAIVKPAANIDVELRIISVTALTALANEYCIANLFEIALGGAGVGVGGGGTGVSFPLNPDVNALGNKTGAVTLDLSLSDSHYFTLTLTGNVTFTFSNPPASGKEMSFVIDITQDATGGRTITWPGSVRSDPAVGSGADARTVVVGSTVDGGTNYDVLIVTGGSVTPGASKALDNLASVAINTSLLSDTDDTDDLGSASFEWRDLYIDGTANIDTLAATTMSGTLTMGGNNISGVGDYFLTDANRDIGSTITPLDGLFAKRLRLETGGVLTTTATMIRNNVGNMDLNVAASTDTFDFTFAGADKILFSQSSGLNKIDADQYDVNSDIQFQDIVSDPAVNGNMRRNGADVKVFSGGAVRNMSDIVAGGGNEFDDNVFRIRDSVDTTKKIAFEATNITTATTRTLTIQDLDLTIAGTNITQTFSGSQSFDDIAKLDMNSNITFKAATFDIGDGTNPVSDFFVERMRFPTNIAPIANAHSISVEALTPDTTVMNVPTGEDWQIQENGAQGLATSLLLLDTSGNTFTIGAGILSTRFQGSATINMAITHPTTSGSAVAFTTGGASYTFDKDITLSGDLLSNDGTQDIGTSTTGFNNIYSDNTLFCSNLKVWTGDSDINVFNDLDMQAGDTIDFADTSSTAGSGTGGTLPANVENYLVIKVNGVLRRVPFYPV